MPDKWEYPWYAAWDLAFHTIALSLVDFDFAKEQLLLMLRNLYAHPNGQIPAYEWNFSDVNPPVHAWATLVSLPNGEAVGPGRPAFPGALLPGADAEFQLVGQPQGPAGPQRFRRRISRAGQHRRLRSQCAPAHRRIPGSGRRHRLDGVLLPQHAGDRAHSDRARSAMYEEIAFRFLEHFFWITYAMDRIGEHHDEMWDNADGFFYDLLHLPNGDAIAFENPLHGGAAADMCAQRYSSRTP